MAKYNLDIVILTSKESNRYFTGYQSIVWDSKVSTPGTIIFSVDGRMTFIGSHNARQTILTTSCMRDEDIITYSRNPEHQSQGSFIEALKEGLERHHFANKRVGKAFGVGFRPHLSYPVLQGRRQGTDCVEINFKLKYNK